MKFIAVLIFIIITLLGFAAIVPTYLWIVGLGEAPGFDRGLAGVCMAIPLVGSALVALTESVK
jgi:hypothetical protein